MAEEEECQPVQDAFDLWQSLLDGPTSSFSPPGRQLSAPVELSVGA